jgi:hypothetical protein
MVFEAGVVASAVNGLLYAKRKNHLWVEHSIGKEPVFLQALSITVYWETVLCIL